MDLAPPPLFRHEHHHHLRYGNVLHPPDFIPQPYTSHLPPPPPPPQPRPSHILLPPPPPPPTQSRYIGNPPLPPRFTFSPPRHPIIERSHPYELPPSKPYFYHEPLPSPPPPRPRENRPLPFIRDYPERNPIFKSEIFRPGSSDNYFHDLAEKWDRDLRWGSMELHTRVSDTVDHGRYRDVLYQSREMYDKKDDDRRWDIGSNDWARSLYKERNYDERRWDSSINDRGRELYIEADYDQRRWDNRTDDRARKFYCEGDGEGRRWNYGNSEEVLLRLEKRQRCVEDDLNLDRFSGRLGRVVIGGDLIRSKKKRRMQKKNPLRIKLGKACSRHGGGYKSQHFSKELSSGSFRGNRKQEFEWSQPRSEDKQEREQSPMELAISFKSNALVAKAILAPSCPGVNSDLNLRDAVNGEAYNMSGSPSNKTKDVVGTDILTRGSDLRYDSQGSSKELPDEAAVSGRGYVTASDANDLGENALKNEKDMNLRGPNNIGRKRRSRLRKKRKNGKQHVCETSLQITKDIGDINNAKGSINSLSVVPQLNSDTALSKGNTSSEFIGTVPDTVLPPTLGFVVSENGDVNSDSYKPSVPNLKRKRSCLTTLSASSCMADNLGGRCSGRAHSLVPTTEDTDHMFQLRTDEGAPYAHEPFLANENTGHEGSLGFNHHANAVHKFVSNRASVLGTEKSPVESFDRHRLDYSSKHSSQDGLASLESAFARGASGVEVSVEGHGMVGLSRPEEDKYFSGIREPNSASESYSVLLQNHGSVIISNVGTADGNSEEIFSDQVNIRQVGLDAEEFRSLEGADVADCSNASSGIATSSHFLSADRKGILTQIDVSFPGAMCKKSSFDGTELSDNTRSIEGSPKAISNGNACSSINYSPKLVGKRKTRDAQMGLSGSKTNLIVRTVRSIGGEVARLLAKDRLPSLEVDRRGEKDSCEEDDSLNKVLSRVEDSSLEVDHGANGYRKKRKGGSPISNLSSILEDDTVANGLTSDCPKLDRGFTGLSEREAEQREVTPSVSAAIKNCDTINLDGEVGSETIYVADVDETMADGAELHANDGLASSAKNLPLFADRNCVYASSSTDDLLASGFDRQSCMSSPEELTSYSDFSGKSKTSSRQLENEMSCWTGNLSNRKPVTADHHAFSLGKSLEKALDNSLTNTDPLSPPEDNNKVVKKLNLVHGKLTLSEKQPTSAIPKVFPGQHPLNFSNPRKFHPTQVTKSRTWHRAGSSPLAVTEPKSQPSPLPQSHETKTARSTHSSYIRKGNSLVRKPSLSHFTAPGFHGSGSSTYRLTPCSDNSKNNQASDSRGDADAPTLLRTEQVKISQKYEALPIHHSQKSLNCKVSNLEDPLPVGNAPRNSCLSKTSDASENAIASSAVPDVQTGLVNNSDIPRLVEGTGKKIMYVKRRSNQLVAAPNSDDMSMIGVDKNQAAISDGYYKSRKNQLVRASSENHVKKANTNLKSCGLSSHTVLPRTSSRRLAGFSKTYRSSKFSFVWKLHDKQSSEKDKNSVGPQKVWPHLLPWKRASYWRSFMHALGTKPNNSALSTASQKLLISRKRGAIYTRSIHGYSLRMSKVLSVSGSSLKWSKSIEKNSKKANEEATRAVAAAEKRKKQEKDSLPIASKSRNHVSRKSVLSVKLRPGERIFRIGSERYKMDPSRRTLHRITGAEIEPLSSVVLQSEMNAKRSYVPRRLLIGNDEYVRIGNGNQLVRDPKKRTRVLASEKVRWSLRTARLRMARKKRYCQFFTRFGKCNKDDGKCPYIHDPSKIAVCTKFLSGSCSNPDCKLTHKVIPERMQDCSYFLKGSCSNENCPYRHVNVNPDSTVCESFLRGYCADGNECRKKHTYVCPAFESTGFCPQASTCKLHHPKKMEKKPTTEPKIVRGRYFDGGLIGDADCSMDTTEKLSAKGKDDTVCHEGRFPDYISLDVSDEEMDHILDPRQVCDDIIQDAH
ncbi:UNVERIFIED_CONTAM: Zinc finger CCCH domain-containing protein 7 [Sesamum latifolium]|uniref:Zinc finger CCCH domain-containing protein 7 n=1 Tax=Sesamum latifolium TaxID=2727402 RepID=A0AAW2W9D7_9LAMI